MIQSIVVVIVFGFFGKLIFEKIGLPGLIGMILAGILVGPYELNLLSPAFLQYSKEIRSLGLIVILLRAGLSLSRDDFKTTKVSAILMSFLPALFEIVGIMLVGTTLFSFSWIDSLLLGTVIAAVSPAVIVPKMINIIDKGYGQDKKIPQLILAGASLDDVLVLVLFTLSLSLAQTQKFSVNLFLELPVALLLGALFGMGMGLIWKVIDRKLLLKREVLTAGIFISASIVFYFEDKIQSIMPFSALIFVLSFGIILKEKYESRAVEVKKEFGKIWRVAEVFLFVLVGAAVDFSYVTQVGWEAITFLSIGLMFRSVGVWVSISKTKFTIKEKLFCVFSYLPKATVQAAIGAIPLAYGLSSGPFILAIAVLSILITAPLGAILIDRTYRQYLNKDEID